MVLTDFTTEELHLLEKEVTNKLDDMNCEEYMSNLDLLVDIKDEIYTRNYMGIMDDNGLSEEILKHSDVAEKNVILQLLQQEALNPDEKNKAEIRLKELRRKRAIFYGFLQEE